MDVTRLSAFGALYLFAWGLCPQDPRGIFSQMKKDPVDG